MTDVLKVVVTAVDNLSVPLNTMGAKITAFSKKAIKAATLLGVGSAVAIGAMVKKFGSVEEGFAKVQTLLGEGADSQKIFGKTVQDLNVLMGNQGDQLDVLSGLYQTISAGITDTTEAQEFLEVATRAAVGGSAELNTVILAGTKAMSGFGLGVGDTERIFDVFAATVKAGQTTMGELATAFPNVAGLAGEAGITLEETAGTLAGLTKFLGSTDEATTALGQTIITFLKPGTAMAEAIEKAGFESGVAMLKELGLNKATKILTDSVGGNADAIAKLFLNKRALIGVLPMVGKGMGDIASSMDIVEEATGLTNKQYGDMTDTINFQLGVAMSDLKNLATELGEAFAERLIPIIEDLTTFIKGLREKWNALDPEMQQTIINTSLMVTAMLLLAGPAGIIFKVIGGIVGVTKVIIAMDLAAAPFIVTIGVLVAGLFALFDLAVRVINMLGGNEATGAFTLITDKVKAFTSEIMKAGTAMTDLGDQAEDSLDRVSDAARDISDTGRDDRDSRDRDSGSSSRDAANRAAEEIRNAIARFSQRPTGISENLAAGIFGNPQLNFNDLVGELRNNVFANINIVAGGISSAERNDLIQEFGRTWGAEIIRELEALT